MALRIRRGTEAQLQLVTPVEGELIYTTDTKDLFVGDGTTLGGIKVGGDIPASINDLTDVSIAGITVGQVLKWNGTAFVPGNDDTTIGTGSGIVEGSNYRINIVADDSTTLINTNTKQLDGLFKGYIINQITDDIILNNVVNEAKLDIITDDGDLILDHSTGDLYNNIGQLLIDSAAQTFFGDVQGTLTGTVTGSVIGNVTGDVNGDVRGSVFSDSSDIIIDGQNSLIYASVVISKNNYVTVEPNIDTSENIFNIVANDNRSSLKLTKSSNNDLSITTDQLGAILFERNDPFNNDKTVGVLVGRTDKFIFSHDVTAAHTDITKIFTWGDRKFSIGKFFANATLDVAGNAIFDGDVNAAAFKGSIMTDDSITIIDAISGNITAPGFIQFGSFTKTARDQLPASNGMVIYNITSNKFQGYQNGAWINLDDGITDP